MSKLLFIRYKKSANILEGGEQGSQKNYNVLLKLLGDNNITTYYIHDETKKHTIKDYIKGIFFFLKNYYFGLSPKRATEIANLALNGHYDYVFIDRSVFGIIAKYLKNMEYKGQIISFFHNVEKLYFEAKIPKYAPWRILVTHCADKNDEYCCKYSDKIIALNKRDGDEIKKRYNRIPDAFIPVVMNDKYNKKQYPEGLTSHNPICLFLGAYFGPNNEGIEWFMKNVYPNVNIKVIIVGKGMGKLRDNYNIPNDVKIISDAPDLLPYFEKAEIMILPIFKGSGMKVKTCESLMYGKNIIATTEAFQGYELDYNKVGAKCDTAKEFIDAIKKFIESPKPIFNNYSRNIFLKKYTENTVISSFKDILNIK